MDYKLAVLSVCDYAFSQMPKTHAVSQIMDRFGYDYRLYVDPLWHGWPSKVKYYTEAVPKLLDTDPDITHVMFIDSSDVVLLCGPDELMARWKQFNHPWVYNAEPHIWPLNSFQPEDYPTPPDAYYRYLNGGAYIGELKHVAHYYRKWTETPIVCEKSDQHWMAERYLLDHPDAIQLDHGCKLFQCMCGSDWLVDIVPGHLYNRETETDPKVIHFNGGTDITATDRRALWSQLV